ncbi:MAG: DUF2284 domain-containing protein [Methanoregula sp.]
MTFELEKTAFNAGYTLALAFVNGSYRLCETCNVKGESASTRPWPGSPSMPLIST